MTCIAGFVDKENKKVFIGADSAASDSSQIVIRKDKKVFKVGDFIMGGTSSFRMIQLLQFSFNPPKIGEKEIFKYMCTDFINEVRETFKKGGFLKKYDEEENGGRFLVGYKNRLFMIDSDFQVGENLEGFAACGCGDLFALGAMFNSSETKGDLIVIEGLTAAAHFSPRVGGPFNILYTE